MVIPEIMKKVETNVCGKLKNLAQMLLMIVDFEGKHSQRGKES